MEICCTSAVIGDDDRRRRERFPSAPTIESSSRHSESEKVSKKISEQRHKKIEIFVERIYLDYHEEQASTGSQKEVSQRR